MADRISPYLLPHFSESFKGLDFAVTLPLHRGHVRCVLVTCHLSGSVTEFGCSVEVPMRNDFDLRSVIEFTCIEAALQYSQRHLPGTCNGNHVVEFDPVGWR